MDPGTESVRVGLLGKEAKLTIFIVAHRHIIHTFLSRSHAPAPPTHSPHRSEMAGLQSLPSELLQEITSLVYGKHPSSRSLTRLEAKALCDMRSVCWLTNAIAEPILFRHLVMNINPEDLDAPCYTQMQDLMEGLTNASIHAKALTIHLSGGKSGEGKCNAPFMGTLALALEPLRDVNSVM